jgi:CO dehydrogenase maturation factor
MTTTIAVAGKGGTGKTLIAALLIRYILDHRLGSVLAVDADPSTNLHLALGTTIDGSVGDIREDTLTLIQSGRFPAGLNKNDYLDYQLHALLTEAAGFDVLAMGRPEGPGCYCAVNHLLRLLIDHLAQQYDFVVIDNEAGMEHLSRRTTRDVDLLLLISDPTVRGIITAAEMQTLAGRLQIRVGRTQLIVNRVGVNNAGPSYEDLPTPVRATIEARGLNVASLVPQDENVAEYDAQGRPFFDLPSDAPAPHAVFAICATFPELGLREAIIPQEPMSDGEN